MMTLTLRPSGPVSDARDLGYLLFKHPDRVQTFHASSGTAHVMYPVASERECTAALLLEVDPVGEYVTDRPYAATSQLAVALGSVFSTAMRGDCPSRPEAAAAPLDLTIRIPALPCRGGEDLLRRFFEPLGWIVGATRVPLDPEIPHWGQSHYLDVTLTGTIRLADALSHVYVLLPVLDNTKHYWVSRDEAEKLVRRGGAWVANHPERDLITRRYLAHKHAYVDHALERLQMLDQTPVEAEPPVIEDDDAPVVPLKRLRHDAVLTALGDVGARRVVDLGCGQGALLRKMIADARFTELVGVDVSARDLEIASRRLHLERGDRRSEKVQLLHSSVTYIDDRIAGYDAVVLMEVIEHLDVERLPALERSVFGHARPAAVVVTTPNADYNVRYETLPAGEFRHPDHRFEWGRTDFAAWVERTAREFGYRVEIRPVGVDDPEVGSPTQLALFRREAGDE